jgi:hypothetical protein
VPEPDPAIHPDTGTIRAAMLNGRSHSPEYLTGNASGLVPSNADDSTHRRQVRD